MKFRSQNLQILLLVMLAWLPFCSGSVAAQITSSTSSNGITSDAVRNAQEASRLILVRSGDLFREGLTAYVAKDRGLAAKKFDKAIETFLYSPFNIQKDPKLQVCFNQLIETIYRIEYPSESQLPRVRDLALTCTWNIETELGDSVAAIARLSADRSSGIIQVGEIPSQDSRKIGFITQELEPSPLDELSKMDLDSNHGLLNAERRVSSSYFELAKAGKLKLTTYRECFALIETNKELLGKDMFESERDFSTRLIGAIFEKNAVKKRVPVVLIEASTRLLYDAERQRFQTNLFIDYSPLVNSGTYKLVDRNNGLWSSKSIDVSFFASKVTAKEIYPNLKVRILGIPVAIQDGTLRFSNPWIQILPLAVFVVDRSNGKVYYEDQIALQFIKNVNRTPIVEPASRTLAPRTFATPSPKSGRKN